MFAPFSRSALASGARSYHSHGFGYGGGPWGWRRGPSRLLWFLIGAGSATWWIKHKERELKGYYGHCKRAAIERVANESAARGPPVAQEGAGAPASTAFAHRGPSHYPLPHPASPGWNAPAPGEQTPGEVPPLAALKAAFEDWEKNQDKMMENEREHMTKVSRQAMDAMVDITEATLESVLSTAEALKAKLAQHKAQREKVQKAAEIQGEEQQNNPTDTT